MSQVSQVMLSVLSDVQRIDLAILLPDSRLMPASFHLNLEKDAKL